ncbi:MAG: SRPBCC family protein [Acidobacteria bacterium]|nr:SRPBCC family protein [Acidobacteriota bacterium]
MARDQVIHGLHKTGDALDATYRDLRNRTKGVIAETKSRISREVAADSVLVEKARSKLGRLVSHPSAIKVTVKDGIVTLSGPILAREVDRLLSRISSLRGIRGVENRLEIHQTADRTPGLQGGVARPGEPMEFMQTHWSPTARLLASGTGMALAIAGLRKGRLWGAALVPAGAALLARGLSNKEFKRLVGFGAGRKAVAVHKNITVGAPVEQVFEFWNNFQNFPKFMTSVREVRDSGAGRSHWTVSGPAGVPVEWDAVITRMVPNKTLAWKSVRGSTIGHSGIVHFFPNANGTTTIDIKLSYNPPGGALGHSLAALFGADPKRQMDEDLMRMKSFLETGVPPRDAAERELVH